MLLVEATVDGEKRYWQLVEIVRGEEVHPETPLSDGPARVHTLMTEDQLAEARRQGFACEVVTDYATLPDPRDEVSKENRFEAELRRLRGGEGRR